MVEWASGPASGLPCRQSCRHSSSSRHPTDVARNGGI